jgi:hypothetical protein
MYDRYMTGLYLSYHFSWTLPRRLHASWPAGSSKRAGMFQTWNACRSFRFWTESPPTRGWGLPKFHSQVLISYTWLPLRDPWLAPSKKTGQHQCLPNEETQVDIKVFRIPVATLGCINGTQSTSKVDAVWIGKS